MTGPDETLQLMAGDAVVARCSCWWKDVAVLEGRKLGVIGGYSATDGAASGALLEQACDLLASKGCDMAAGPMDGTTWRRYRFIIERGTEPAFFLEPDNPDAWPAYWKESGFEPLATYTSAINEDLGRIDPRTDERRSRLADAGIHIRAFDPPRADAELRRIFELSLIAFRDNFLYTPISGAEFMAQQTALLPYVRPELVLMAEHGDRLAGFMFAVPDVLEAQRTGAATTVIMKTMAVDPSFGGIGLGGTLFDLAQRAAHGLGFTRAIHALIHDANVSGRISGRYARTMRRYALFSRTLST